MNLLFIAESFPTTTYGDLTGGVETRDFYLARELGVRHHITIITNARVGADAEEINGSVRILRVGTKVERGHREHILVRCRFFITAVLKSLSVPADIVQGSNVFSQAVAWVVGSLKGIPKVAFIPDVYIGEWIKNRGIITGLIGEILERFTLFLPWDGIIALSATTKEKLVTRHPHTRHLIVIGGGADIAACKQLKVKKASLPTVVMVGRLTPYKRVDDLIRAIDIVKGSVKTVRLVVVGEGAARPDLEQLVKNLHLENRVVFTGFLETHRAVLKNIKTGHVFCLPSTVEGFGLVTIEAAACGVPFVNAAIPATREVTKEGLGGLLCAPGNYHDLAVKLKKLLTNKARYRQKVTEAVQLANYYSWNRIGHETETFFQSLIKTS